MLPAREPHAVAPALPSSAQAVVVEVPPRAQREQELQAAAQVRNAGWLCKGVCGAALAEPRLGMQGTAHTAEGTATLFWGLEISRLLLCTNCCCRWWWSAWLPSGIGQK